MTFLPSGFVPIPLGLRGFTGFDLRQRRISSFNTLAEIS